MCLVVDNRQTSCSISIYVKCVCARWKTCSTAESWVAASMFEFSNSHPEKLSIFPFTCESGDLMKDFSIYRFNSFLHVQQKQRSHIILEFEQVAKAPLHPGWYSIRWPFHSGKSSHFSSSLSYVSIWSSHTHECRDIKENPKKSIHTRDEY